jgi:6-phosphogluconolactonase
MSVSKPDVTICKDAADLAAHAADRIVQESRDAIRARGRFLIALAGGSTPEAAYGRLAQPPRRHAVDWGHWVVFFGDERFLPPDDSNSNTHMARHALLDRVPVPPGNLYPVETSLDTPEEAADAYARTLAETLTPPAGQPPHFDLILLGLGDDGHTASLFPHMPSLAVKDAWVTATPPGTLPPPVDRVTFTYPILNAARSVVFLVSGARKADILRILLEDNPPKEERPAAGIHPYSGRLTWLVDAEAAAQLSRSER